MGKRLPEKRLPFQSTDAADERDRERRDTHTDRDREIETVSVFKVYINTFK